MGTRFRFNNKFYVFLHTWHHRHARGTFQTKFSWMLFRSPTDYFSPASTNYQQFITTAINGDGVALNLNCSYSHGSASKHTSNHRDALFSFITERLKKKYQWSECVHVWKWYCLKHLIGIVNLIIYLHGTVQCLPTTHYT